VVRSADGIARKTFPARDTVGDDLGRTDRRLAQLRKADIVLLHCVHIRSPLTCGRWLVFDDRYQIGSLFSVWSFLDVVAAQQSQQKFVMPIL
jgi:hypothetical protein